MTDGNITPLMLLSYEERDLRPQKNFWAPGNYICKCLNCNEYFIGDKRALSCADCAYKQERKN